MKKGIYVSLSNMRHAAYITTDKNEALEFLRDNKNFETVKEPGYPKNNKQYIIIDITKEGEVHHIKNEKGTIIK